MKGLFGSLRQIVAPGLCGGVCMWEGRATYEAYPGSRFPH
jgi:hypothetical protein